MYSVHLNNIQLTGRHGVYAGEKLLDAPYEVNISCRFAASAERITALEETVNYETVYELLLQYFNHPYPLLETLAYDLAGAVKERFPAVNHIHIRIEKRHPPIAGMQGGVGVSYEWPSA